MILAVGRPPPGTACPFSLLPDHSRQIELGACVSLIKANLFCSRTTDSLARLGVHLDSPIDVSASASCPVAEVYYGVPTRRPRPTLLATQDGTKLGSKNRRGSINLYQVTPSPTDPSERDAPPQPRAATRHLSPAVNQSTGPAATQRTGGPNQNTSEVMGMASVDHSSRLSCTFDKPPIPSPTSTLPNIVYQLLLSSYHYVVFHKPRFPLYRTSYFHPRKGYSWGGMAYPNVHTASMKVPVRIHVITLQEETTFTVVLCPSST